MPKYYTTAEAAEMLKIKERAVLNYINQGKIRAFSLTGKTKGERGRRDLRIPEEAIAEFTEANRVVY